MLIAVAACVALYASRVVGLFFGQRKILFRCDAAEVDPATLGLKAEILRLKTEDGEKSARVARSARARTALDPLFSRQRRRHSTCASSAFAPWPRRAWGFWRSNIAAMPARPALQASGASSSMAKRLMRRRSRAALRRSASSLSGSCSDRASPSRSPRATSLARSCLTRPIRRSPTSRRLLTGSSRFAHCSATRSAMTC